jgi:pilus assembly protein CpaE
MKRLSFLILSGRHQLEIDLVNELKPGLHETGRAQVDAVLTDPTELHDCVARCQPDVVLIEIGEDATTPLDQYEKLAAPRPLLMISGPQEDTGLMLRALRLGAREFLPSDPGAADLKAAVERILLDRLEAPRKDKLAPIVAVLGSKGGVGATVVACQLGAELGKLGGRVVIVDLHLKLGDVALYFDINPRYTLANLAAEREELDAAYLEMILEPHASGVQVLASPARVEEAELITGSSLQSSLDILRSRFDWVVVDAPGSWDETTMMLLDRAEQVFLVTLMDVPSLNHSRQHLDLIQRLGHPGDKVRLIANRYSQSTPVSKADLADFLDRAPDLLIPDDQAATNRSVNEGKPLWQLAERNSLRQAFAGLAASTYGWCDMELPESLQSDRLPLLRRFTRRFNRAAN